MLSIDAQSMQLISLVRTVVGFIRVRRRVRRVDALAARLQEGTANDRLRRRQEMLGQIDMIVSLARDLRAARYVCPAMPAERGRRAGVDVPELPQYSLP